jgi:hypothetical protein
MIDSITIKNVATYDNEGVKINNLKKINFIYGGNGTGKTTISNYLKNQNDDKYNDCEIVWKNNLSVSTLVYNKKFRDENFGLGKIKGVFTLGKATKDEKELVESKLAELKNLKQLEETGRGSLKGHNDAKNVIETSFIELCWKKLKVEYEDVFREAFKGALHKNPFKEKLLNEFDNNTNNLVSYDNLLERAKTIFGKVPENIEPLSLIEFNYILQIEENSIWNKKVVGKRDIDIAGFVQRLNISDWVHQGKNYIQKDSNVCPFCQQETITDDFKKQLENFFDESYINDINLLKELFSSYTALTSNILNELNNIEEREKNLGNTKLDIDKYSSYLKTLNSQFIANNEKLKTKLKEPSREITLQSVREQLELISNLINEANEKIRIHNQIVTNFNNEKKILISDIWKFLSEELRNEITEFKRNINGKNRAIESIEGFLEENNRRQSILEDEIKELNKNIVGIESTIDDINTLLRNMGFLSFKIVSAEEKGYYQIIRENGEIAEDTLSEGEITFITFLYFLQLAEGGLSEDNITEQRVLVIDDPISSLDSNILFIVSTLLKDFIKNIKEEKGNIVQLILFTHNIYFHKEVSFVDMRNNDSKNITNYWILRKNGNISSIQAYEEKNPIQTSYQLLWSEMRNDNISSILSIQNIMRRILENYFKLLGNITDETIIDKFPTIPDKQICKSLYYWINDGSHSLNEDIELELAEYTIQNYKDVLKKIFEYSGHIAHYNMMMGISESD